MKKEGFTLIEILVVIAVLGIVAVVGTQAFFSILRASAKAKNLQIVKQNGDYALSVMVKMIRNARAVEGGGSSVTILNPDNNTTTFNCCLEDSQLTIASQSGSLSCGDSRLISEEVKVENCDNVFEITPGVAGVNPPIVTIKFTLSWAQETSGSAQRASVNFQSTVALRNY